MNKDQPRNERVDDFDEALRAMARMNDDGMIPNDDDDPASTGLGLSGEDTQEADE